MHANQVVQRGCGRGRLCVGWCVSGDHSDGALSQSGTVCHHRKYYVGPLVVQARLYCKQVWLVWGLREGSRQGVVQVGLALSHGQSHFAMFTSDSSSKSNVS